MVGLFFETHVLLNDGLDLSLMYNAWKSYICNIKQSNYFWKGKFLNAKKLLSFIQIDTNEKKIVKSLATFHTAVKIFLNPFMTEAVFV